MDVRIGGRPISTDDGNVSDLVMAVLKHAEMICGETLAEGLTLELTDGTMYYDAKKKQWYVVENEAPGEVTNE